MGDTIKVIGLRDFQGVIKKADANVPKAMRMASDQAADMIIKRAKPKIPTKSGAAKASVKKRSTQSLSNVIAGGRRAPYYGWLDFGGRVGRGGSIRRPFKREGRYIYKAYFQLKPTLPDLMEESLVDIARKAGLEVET